MLMQGGGGLNRYDELHPSERMEEIFSNAFIDVVRGKSKYGVYY
jgi:hypothetical protein